MQSATDDTGFFQTKADWQFTASGARPNIEAFAPRLGESCDVKDTPVAKDGGVNRPRSAAIESSSAPIYTTCNNESGGKHRPISAPYHSLEPKGSSAPSNENQRSRTLLPTSDHAHPTSVVLNATRAVTEAIYSSGFYKSQLSSAFASQGRQQFDGNIVPFGAYAVINSNSNTAKLRANSASRRVPQRSAVERALSIGRSSQHLLKTDKELKVTNDSRSGRNAQLAEMLEGDIIEKLEYAMATKR
jgi:hypothetical protein